MHSESRHVNSALAESSPFTSSDLSCHRYMFDEPSSYLDVKQRLKAAQAIRNLLAADK